MHEGQKLATMAKIWYGVQQATKAPERKEKKRLYRNVYHSFTENAVKYVHNEYVQCAF